MSSINVVKYVITNDINDKISQDFMRLLSLRAPQMSFFLLRMTLTTLTTQNSFAISQTAHLLKHFLN